ncbi:hypothetical protein [Nitrospira sp. BLG_2]
MNDFGEHNRFVSHQADTKAKIPGKATIMIDIPTRYLIGLTF